MRLYIKKKNPWTGSPYFEPYYVCMWWSNDILERKALGESPGFFHWRNSGIPWVSLLENIFLEYGSKCRQDCGILLSPSHINMIVMCIFSHSFWGVSNQKQQIVEI